MARKINNLLRFDNNQTWLVWDMETEGLNLFSTKCWQLSYSIYKGQTLVESFEKYPYWEDISVSEGAARVTGFNLDDYKSKGEDPKLVLEHFNKYLYDPEIFSVGANLIGYDIFIHNNFLRLLGKPSDYSYIERIFDVQNIQKSIELDYHKGEAQSQTAWNFKLRSFRKKGLKVSVEALCKKYGIPYDPYKAHDASYDNNLTYQILKKQLYLLNQ